MSGGPGTPTILIGLASVVLGGGGAGSIVALWKLKPEGDQIVVSSAKDVVLIQRGVIEDMEKRADDQQKRMDDMEKKFTEQSRDSVLAVAEARQEARELRKERDAERASNWELRSRIEVLEAEVAALRDASGPHPITDPDPKETT